MFNTGKYSDVTLIADDGEIKAHRILLAAGSELMNAMLIGQYYLTEVCDIKNVSTPDKLFICFTTSIVALVKILLHQGIGVSHRCLQYE